MNKEKIQTYPSFTTEAPAILIRRIPFGESDLVITLLCLEEGKVSVIAKGARASKKRFMGVLEPFSEILAVIRKGRAKLPLLAEASVLSPNGSIREDVLKMAYASYWAEVLNTWMEEGTSQKQLYLLFKEVLELLDADTVSPDYASIRFQMRFLAISGMLPEMTRCLGCGTELDRCFGTQVNFDIREGGIFCGNCSGKNKNTIHLTKGMIKELIWIHKGDPYLAKRLRISAHTIQACHALLERFVPDQLSRPPRSLDFLHKIRKPHAA